MKERLKFTLFLFKHAKNIIICSFGIIKQLLPSYEMNIQIVYPRRVVFPHSTEGHMAVYGPVSHP